MTINISYGVWTHYFGETHRLLMVVPNNFGNAYSIKLKIEMLYHMSNIFRHTFFQIYVPESLTSFYPYYLANVMKIYNRGVRISSNHRLFSWSLNSRGSLLVRFTQEIAYWSSNSWHNMSLTLSLLKQTHVFPELKWSNIEALWLNLDNLTK